MEIFITAALAMIVLGLMFGAGLALASRVLTVQTDECMERVQEALPGTNCGACGYGGCVAYAKAVAHQGEKANLCIPGGEAAAGAVARIMGVECADAEASKRAVVHCRGNESNSGTRCDYRGFEDCRAAALISGGPKSCTYGCLGYGSCAQACPFGAITMDSGLALVDDEKCTGCGICVGVCPRGLISLLDARYDAYVACSSRDSGKAVKNVCEAGCIACGACAKKDPSGAVTMEGGLPVLDYEKAGGDFSVVSQACPTKCVVTGSSEGAGAVT